jgi:glycosyltransferase involved in cell wall biosynthesis
MVTCLCLTRNRREWLPKAIEAFLAQTYEQRELLIVADGEDISDLIPSDPRVRVLISPDGAKIGSKRNQGCAAAAGEIIVHWDDDDYSAPGRIAEQVARLQESGRSVTGYSSMRFTDGERWWLNTNTPLGCFDTSLCYSREFWAAHHFDEISDGEGESFRRAAVIADDLIAVPANAMMHATIHPGNTSARVIGEGWEEVAG